MIHSLVESAAERARWSRYPRALGPIPPSNIRATVEALPNVEGCLTSEAYAAVRQLVADDPRPTVTGPPQTRSRTSAQWRPSHRRGGCVL